MSQPSQPARQSPDSGDLGIEIAQATTRLTVVTAADPARRWQDRLDAPPAADDALAAIEHLVARAHGELGVSAPGALGVAIWADVNHDDGTVPDRHLGAEWHSFPLAERLGARLGCPVLMDTATNAAALAEWSQGAGMGARALLYVHNGQEITAAVVTNGWILHGAGAAGGALGHTPVGVSDARCSCGARGHLETIASAQALVRTLIGRAADSEETLAAMLRMTNGRAEAMSAPQVVALAASGDPIARRLVDEAIEALAAALAGAAALVGPDRIVLAGPLAGAGEEFFAQFRARFAAHRGTILAPSPIILPSTLEPRGALLGALALAARARATA